MSYVTPKVDWTSVDGVTVDDLNRIEGNIAAVKEQADNTAATGVPKLVTYEYDLYATTANQTKFDIPYLYFDKATDTIEVKPSGIDYPVGYTVTNPVTNADQSITKGYITFTTGVTNGTFVKMRILKNAPIGPDGAISGGVIAVGSLPQDRIVGSANIAKKYDGSTTDLNTCLTHGMYSFSTTTTNGLKSGNGIVEVLVSDGGTYNGVDKWIWQFLKYTDGETAYRWRANAGTWSSWTKPGLANGVVQPNLNADMVDGYHVTSLVKTFNLNSTNIDNKYDESYIVDISLDDVATYGTKPATGWLKITNDFAGHFVRQIATTCNSGTDAPKMWYRTKYSNAASPWSAWCMVGTAKDYQISLLNGWYFGFPSDRAYNGILATLGNVCVGQMIITAGTVTAGTQIAQLPVPKTRTHITANRQDTGANQNFYLNETGMLSVANSNTLAVTAVTYVFHFCYELASPY